MPSKVIQMYLPMHILRRSSSNLNLKQTLQLFEHCVLRNKKKILHIKPIIVQASGNLICESRIIQMHRCINYKETCYIVKVRSMDFYTIRCVTNIPEKFLTTTWSPQKDLDAIHVHTAMSWHHVQDLQDPSPQKMVINMRRLMALNI